MGVVRKLKKLISIPQVYTKARNDYKEMKVVQYLRQWNPKLQQDEKGNLFLINPGTPLLCAHMDTRQIEASTNYQTTPGVLTIKEGILKNGKCLGADDKCGVAIAMQIYEELGDEVSLLFTVQEESGLHGAKFFVENNRARLESCLYCIIPDRMNGGDIIGRQNSYCSLDFQAKIAELSKDSGYLPARGVCCDADAIRHVLNCVNMSCGYLYHHTDNEQVDIDEFYNAYVTIYNIVTTLQERMPIYQEPIAVKLVDNNRLEEIKSKYYNNTYKSNKKNKNRPLSLGFGYDDYDDDTPAGQEEDEYKDIPGDDYGNPMAFNRGDLERQNSAKKKYTVNVKVNAKKNLITFDADTEMLINNQAGDIIKIPAGEYWYFKSYNKDRGR